MFKFKSQQIFVLIPLVFLSVLLLSLPVVQEVLSAQESPYLTTFNKVWQDVNDHFFDPKFNGIDWKATREKYKNRAKQAQSLEDATVVINQMLSELNTSHTHFYSKLEPAYYQLLGIFNRGSFKQEIKNIFPNGKLEYTGIGIFTKDINGKPFISAILDGSPATKAGLKVGDELLAVDGKPYQPIQSFVDKAEQEVKISIQRTPDSKSREEVTVIPKKLNPDTLFLEAMRQSIKIIDRNSKKIGYVHIWSYAGDQYQQLLVDEISFGKLKDADGLILDVLVDGERLEGKGVNPDIEVPFPLEYAQGKDPQFDRAVDVLLEQL